MTKLKSICQNIIYVLLLYAFTISIKEYISKSNTYKVFRININGNDFVDSNILMDSIENLVLGHYIYKIDIKKIKNTIEKNDYISSCIVSINLSGNS